MRSAVPGRAFLIKFYKINKVYPIPYDDIKQKIKLVTSKIKVVFGKMVRGNPTPRENIFEKYK